MIIIRTLVGCRYKVSKTEAVVWVSSIVRVITDLFSQSTTFSTHPSDSVYLPGRTSVQLTAFDRQVVNDQRSQDYTITINKEDGCDYDKLAVTLVWVEPGKLLLFLYVTIGYMLYLAHII